MTTKRSRVFDVLSIIPRSFPAVLDGIDVPGVVAVVEWLLVANGVDDEAR